MRAGRARCDHGAFVSVGCDTGLGFCDDVVDVAEGSIPGIGTRSTRKRIANGQVSMSAEYSS